MTAIPVFLEKCPPTNKPHSIRGDAAVRASLAQVLHRFADACSAVGDLGPALRRLAQHLEAALARRKSKARPKALPAAPTLPTIPFTEIDQQRATAALRRAGIVSAGRQP